MKEEKNETIGEKINSGRRKKILMANLEKTCRENKEKKC